MKKTVTLLILLCMSSVVFAQYYEYYPSAYPIPNLVEESVPAFVVQQTEPNRLTPDISYPYSFIPMVNKQACTVDCIRAMSICLRAGNPESLCRSAAYLPCLENCPGEFIAPVEVAYPAPLSMQRQECLRSCDLAYTRCLGAGGTLTTCSRGVLNPCTQQCNLDYPEARVERPAPVGLSCSEMCRWNVEPCFASGSAGCNVVLESCLKACPGYVVPAPLAVETPVSPSIFEFTISMVEPQKPSFWQRVKNFFGF